MENRRIFARRPCKLVTYFSDRHEKCVGEIRDVSLGGLLARINAEHFQKGQLIKVTPQDDFPMEYEVCWIVPSGAGYEMGLSYPNSVAGFWDSWAADLLAGARPTHSEVLERRNQVRLECLLEGRLKQGEQEFVVDILDLGGGGALIELDREIDPSLPLQLTIETPVRVGDVPCHVARAWPGDPALYGLEFGQLRERHRLAVVRLLDLLFRQSA